MTEGAANILLLADEASETRGISCAALCFLFGFVCFSNREKEGLARLMDSRVDDAASVCTGFLVVRNDDAVCADVVGGGGT